MPQTEPAAVLRVYLDSWRRSRAIALMIAAGAAGAMIYFVIGRIWLDRASEWIFYIVETFVVIVALRMFTRANAAVFELRVAIARAPDGQSTAAPVDATKSSTAVLLPS
jgi:hypothetical protein